ncbi:MAG: hypothetical protein ACJAY8_000702 [Sphingobacteriales bacterium]|jgi:hypothetical protein
MVMRFLKFCGLILSVFLVHGCLKDTFLDDRVEPKLEIVSYASSLKRTDYFQFEARFLDEVGRPAIKQWSWRTNHDTILEVSNTGLVSAINYGEARVYVEMEEAPFLKDSLLVTIADTTILASSDRRGVLASSSSYALRGDFMLVQVGNDLRLDLLETFYTSDAIPGLFVYLSNNPNSIDQAFEIGRVTQFAGAHSYTFSGPQLRDFSYVLFYCKPFNARVGHGQML